jgi:hypothetical protein
MICIDRRSAPTILVAFPMCEPVDESARARDGNQDQPCALKF